VYSLTEVGVALDQALAPLGAWGQQHLDRISTLRVSGADSSASLVNS
jgi:DNA-binding HxlR family transcriptional regulator